MKHEIVVGNVGIVLTTEDEAVAEKAYDNYVTLSRDGAGRCRDEDVTWLADGDIHREYQPPTRWVPWKLAPDSDPEERYILVNAADDGEEHPMNIIFNTEEEAIAYAENRCPHGMFYSGAGACPQCGRGAE